MDSGWAESWKKTQGYEVLRDSFLSHHDSVVESADLHQKRLKDFRDFHSVDDTKLEVVGDCGWTPA